MAKADNIPTHPVGHYIAGKYQVLSLLGYGGLGVVYLCKDLDTGEQVAIKKLRQDLEYPPNIIEQTQREAILLAGLRHRNIVRVFDCGLDQGELYIVLEVINGPSLETAIQQHSMDLDTFFHLAFQSLEGLGAAHRHDLLHLDVKPANMMLTEYPSENFTVKLVDFGLSRLTHEMSEKRRDEITIGSVYYISPEQLTHEPLDLRADLYSLGHVFYRVLTGATAYSDPDLDVVRRSHLGENTPTVQVHNPDCSEELCQWVQTLIQKYPEDRPQSTQEAVHTLTPIALKYSKNKDSVWYALSQRKDAIASQLKEKWEEGTSNIHLPRWLSKKINPMKSNKPASDKKQLDDIKAKLKGLD